MSEIAWYTVFCKPRHESQVADYLRSKGLEVYNPTLRVKPVNPRASTTRPFFPRYLFVHADLGTTATSTLQWTPGAIGLVQFEDEAIPVPDTFVTELRQRIDELDASGGLTPERLKKGDPIRIMAGPFAGHDAIFDLRLGGEALVQVLLHWLGQQVKVKVNADLLEKRNNPYAATGSA